MRTVVLTGPGKLEAREVPAPVAGSADVLVAMKACGICGSDPHSVREGGIAPMTAATPLGHEPAGEVAWVGQDVSRLRVGDHVVINPMAVPDAIIGGGGPQGALSDYLLVRQARVGMNIGIVPAHIPWHVAALNEPMAVARHAANRTSPRSGDKVVVFGAGPVGLGALLGYQRLGAGHVVVVDIDERRLHKALTLGADSVVNPAAEDVAERLAKLHGTARDGMGRGGRAGTDVYLDAAGAPSIPQTVFSAAKAGATLGIVAVHRKPVEVDFMAILPAELTIVMSLGYPDEFFEVTDDIVDRWETYAPVVSDLVPFAEFERAIAMAGTPGVADKVVVTFD